ncbi:unnamed protein product [Lathyrus sativus]|nr:unnamed protein product [Lathyrus sativus]
MNLVKKFKRMLRSRKSIYPDEICSGSYVKLSLDTSRKKLKDSHKKTPNGCVCVDVGPERQRFVIKIKIFNHPLFKTLLEGVENEYGYRNDGPLWLPCDVEFFCETLVKIENVFPKSHT